MPTQFSFEEATQPASSFTFEEATAPTSFTFEEAQTVTASTRQESPAIHQVERTNLIPEPTKLIDESQLPERLRIALSGIGDLKQVPKSDSDMALLTGKTVLSEPRLTNWEGFKYSPIGRKLFGVPEPEKAGQVGGGNVGVLEIPEALLEFTSVPPPIADAARSMAEPFMENLPPITRGIVKGIQELALTTPLAPFGAGKAAKAVLGVFAAQYLQSQPEQLKQFTEALDTGNYEYAAQIATGDILGGAIIGVAGIHGLKGQPKIPIDPLVEDLKAKGAPLTAEALAQAAKDIPANEIQIDLSKPSTESPGTGTSALDASRETLASTPPLETKPATFETALAGFGQGARAAGDAMIETRIANGERVTLTKQASIEAAQKAGYQLKNNSDGTADVLSTKPITIAPQIKVAPVEYRGFQAGYETMPGMENAGFLYNLNESIPGFDKGTTASRRALEAAGYTIPPIELAKEPKPVTAKPTPESPVGGSTQFKEGDTIREDQARLVEQSVNPAPKPAGTPVDLGAATLAKHGVKEGDVVAVQLSPGGKPYKATVIGAAAEGNIEVQFPKQGGPVSARGQRRIVDPLKTNLQILASTAGTRRRAEALKPLQGSERVSNNERERAFDDTIRHDPEFDPPSVAEAEAIGARAEGIAEHNRKMDARRAAFKAVGLPEESATNPVAVADALPKLLRYLSERDAPKPTTPKLAPGEKGTGDLLKGQSEEIKLEVETGIDVEKVAARKLKAEQDAAEVKRIQDEQQQNLFRQGPGAKTKAESAKPDAPESYEGTGLKHAIDELERVSFGFKERTPQEKQNMAAAWARSEGKSAEARELTQALIETPRRGLTGDESALLLRHKVELENARNEAASKTFSGDPETKMEGRIAFDRLEKELNDFLDAVATRGSEWGREGRWRQALAYEDFTFATRERIFRVKSGMSAEEFEKSGEGARLLKQIVEEKEYAKALEDHISKLETKTREKGAEEILGDIQKEVEQELPYSKRVLDIAEKFAAGIAKKFNNPERISKARQQIEQLLGPVRQGVGAMTKRGAEAIPSESLIENLATIGAEKIARGKEDFGKWKKAMLNDFGPKIETLLEEVHDAAVKLYHDELAAFESRHGGKKADAVRKSAKQQSPEERKATITEKIKERAQAGKFDEIAPLAQQLAKAAVADGARGWRAIADAVHKQLKEFLPELDYRETLDMISGHGKFKPLSVDEIDVAFRQGKQEMNEVRKIQEVIARQPVKKSGPPFQEGSDMKRRLTAVFNEAKKKFGVIVTDPARQLKSALDARMKWVDNRIKDLTHEIETKHKIVRNRTEPPTSPELEAKIAEKNKLQKERDEIFKGDLTDEQRLKLAVKAMERSESEFRRRREAGEFTVEDEPKPWQDTPEFKAAKARRDAEKAQFEELRDLDEAFAREQEAKDLEAELARTNKSIADKEAKIASGDVSPKAKVMNRPRPNEELELAKQKSELLSRQIAELRNPTKTPEERALTAYKTRLTNSIAELEQRRAYLAERLASGEITEADLKRKPRKTLDISNDPHAMDLKAKQTAVRQAILRAEYQAEMKLRSVPRKIWDGIRQTGSAFVNIMSSYDLSAPRQMFLAMLANSNRLVTNPKVGAKLTFIPLGRMFQALGSESKSAALEQWRKNRPNAVNGTDKIMEIQYTELHTTDFTKQEEFAHSILDDWAALPFKTGNAAKSIVTSPVKLGAKGVRASNRAFITALNTMRAMLADELLLANFKDRRPTDVELRVIGNLVNISTGRGKMSRGVAQAGRMVMWSPSLFSSRLQALTLQPLWGGGELAGSGKARWIVAKEYARWIVSGALLASTIRMFSDPKHQDTESTSTDFGKVVRGVTRLDPWEGFQQFIVVEERLRRGKSTTIGDKTRDISGYGSGEVIWNFFKNKARPDIATVVKATIAAYDYSTDAKKPRVTPMEAVKTAIPVPLSVQDVIKVMRDRGMTEGAIIQILSEFGVGVSVYDEQDKQK